MIKIHMIVALVVLGTILMTGNTITAQAAEDQGASTSVLEDNTYQNSNGALNNTADNSMNNPSSLDDNLAYAKVSNYVNIRKGPSLVSPIIGKLYKNVAVTILSEGDGWDKVTKGSVIGYIKTDYLIKGDDAKKIANSVSVQLATVKVNKLRVRAKASSSARVLTLIAKGDKYQVVNKQNKWAKIKISDNSYGYVSSSYITFSTGYVHPASTQNGQYDQEQVTLENSNIDNNTLSSLGRKIVAFSMQFIGNRYVWGGTSLTHGTDCSGFTKSVFSHFGISLTRTSRSQALSGQKVSMSKLKSGDLVFYSKSGRIDHVAIYIENGKVISASSPKYGIRVTSLYYRTPCKAVRYIY